MEFGKQFSDSVSVGAKIACSKTVAGLHLPGPEFPAFGCSAEAVGLGFRPGVIDGADVVEIGALGGLSVWVEGKGCGDNLVQDLIPDFVVEAWVLCEEEEPFFCSFFGNELEQFGGDALSPIVRMNAYSRNACGGAISELQGHGGEAGDHFPVMKDRPFSSEFIKRLAKENPFCAIEI